MDAYLFLEGLRANPPVFSIERGFVLRTQLYSEKVRNRNAETFHFFENGGSSPMRFRRETIAHLAAVSELILNYDWPRELVLFEPDGRGPLATDGALDALVLSPDGSALIGVEAKGERQKLASLLKGINRCTGSGSHPRTDHKKCEALMEFRPPYFWAVALNKRSLFTADYETGTVRLAPAPNNDPLTFGL